MKDFLEFIEQSEELKAKITELDKNPQTKPEDYIALAKEYGFAITEDDFTPAKAELSKDELDAVAGGKSCFCTGGGGGTGEGTKECPGTEMYGIYYEEKTCACVLGGGGEYKDIDGSTKCRCACVFYGAGDEVGY